MSVFAKLGLAGNMQQLLTISLSKPWPRVARQPKHIVVATRDGCRVTRQPDPHPVAARDGLNVCSFVAVCCFVSQPPVPSSRERAAVSQFRWYHIYLSNLAAEIFIRTVVRKYLIRVNHHVL